MWQENLGTQAGVHLIEDVRLIWGSLNTGLTVSSFIIITIFWAFYCNYITSLLLFAFLECTFYQVLDRRDRAQGYIGVGKCDISLAKAWYRFKGRAGKQMPQSCVPKHRCGTHAPGWLDGQHPTMSEGAVKRKVCFHWSNSCCRYSSSIRVRNCGAFYVYELDSTGFCSLRYCGDRM